MNNGGEKRRKRLIPKIVAYLSLLCWSHALRSDNKYCEYKGTKNLDILPLSIRYGAHRNAESACYGVSNFVCFGSVKKEII